MSLCCVISSFITKPQLCAARYIGHSSCVISSFITKPQHIIVCYGKCYSCVISSFITKPQLGSCYLSDGWRCVISSFITKPQLSHAAPSVLGCCVISSFITKPQLPSVCIDRYFVALYPLSSPNHNFHLFALIGILLRYILFHHQTTTKVSCTCVQSSCVISSFITKPQQGYLFSS